jgi:hypothetical protein
VSEIDAAELYVLLRVAKALREEYREIERIDPDAARQITSLAWETAAKKANSILQRYATERPPTP